MIDIGAVFSSIYKVAIQSFPLGLLSKEIVVRKALYLISYGFWNFFQYRRFYLELSESKALRNPKIQGSTCVCLQETLVTGVGYMLYTRYALISIETAVIPVTLAS